MSATDATQLVLAVVVDPAKADAVLHDMRVMARQAQVGERHVLQQPYDPNGAMVLLHLSRQDRTGIAHVRDEAARKIDDPPPEPRLADARECREHLLGVIEDARERSGKEV